MGLTLRKPDAILLSFDRSVGLLGGAVCTRAAGWRDLIGACAKRRPSLVCPPCPTAACRPIRANGRRTAMTSMTTNSSAVTGGVDTHGQTHHGAALDPVPGRRAVDRRGIASLRSQVELR